MKILLLLIVLCVLCGCQTTSSQTSTHLSDSQAIAIAKQVAAEQHVDLRKYPKVQTDLEWWHGNLERDVLWVNADSTKGFDVLMDRKTGQIVSAQEIPIYPSPPPN
jgi:hypothetical protein